MKLMIASDIHGSALFCEKLLGRFKEEGAERLLLLGDLLYHGPRNDLPEGYAPQKVIELLNSVKECLLCVRGNCEAEVDQMVLEFPVLADYCMLCIDGRTVLATHGHHINETEPGQLSSGELLLCGHTHVPKYADHGSFIYVNPGSVSIPKENSPHSYIILENGKLSWRRLDGSEYMSREI